MAAIAKDRYILLDSVAGWRAAKGSLRDLVADADGHYALAPLPGPAMLLMDEQDMFRCPTAVASEACGRLLVVDAALNLVKRIHPREAEEPPPQPTLRKGWSAKRDSSYEVHEVETLPSIGGKGSAPRQLHQPRGLAVLPNGDFVIADTGNHRVQIFTPEPYALLQVWGRTDSTGNPVEGHEPREFSRPWDVATDFCGRVYVVDRGNKRVQVLGRDGVFLGELGLCYLRDPVRIAVGPSGIVALVDLAVDAVLLFADERTMPQVLMDLRPRSVTFDAEGRLFVGDAIGLIHVFVREGAAYRKVGVGVTGLDDPLIDLHWDASWGLIVIVREEHDGFIRQRLWRVDPRATWVLKGEFATEPLDSRAERCQWDRIALQAELPAGTSIHIETRTADKLAGVGQPETSVLVGRAPPARGGDVPIECLIRNEPGRYLWITVTLRSNGLATPRLGALRVHHPRDSLLQYLPAVYQEDADSRRFLDRFLALFQAEWHELDRRIDDMWQLFDPASAPKHYLPWLAEWLGARRNPEWDEPVLRANLRKAVQSHARRGTRAGLEETLQDHLQLDAKVLEHYRLRRWPALCLAAPLDGTRRLWSRDFYQRLQISSYSQIGYARLLDAPEPAVEPFDWGAHRFSVFFPAHPYAVEETLARVAQVVEREKPAHTEAVYCPVLPRLRVGIQATVGVDSRVGGLSHVLLGRVGTLNYDTILACTDAERGMQARNQPLRPRVGVSLRLQ